MPNIQAIIDSHHLRMWATAMNSDEDWAWALRSDAEQALSASGLSHPLDRLSARFKMSDQHSLAAVMIQTLRRRIRSRMYLRPDDLSQFPNDCVEAILHECPFLAKPETEDDLPIIREYSNPLSSQPLLVKRIRPDFNLVPATKNNSANGLNNVTVHQYRGITLATSSTTQGFITTSRIPIDESEDPNANGDITHLAVRRLEAPPMNSRLYSFGNLLNKWSWDKILKMLL